MTTIPTLCGLHVLQYCSMTTLCEHALQISGVWPLLYDCTPIGSLSNYASYHGILQTVSSRHLGMGTYRNGRIVEVAVSFPCARRCGTAETAERAAPLDPPTLRTLAVNRLLKSKASAGNGIWHQNNSHKPLLLSASFLDWWCNLSQTTAVLSLFEFSRVVRTTAGLGMNAG